MNFRCSSPEKAARSSRWCRCATASASDPLCLSTKVSSSFSVPPTPQPDIGKVPRQVRWRKSWYRLVAGVSVISTSIEPPLRPLQTTLACTAVVFLELPRLYFPPEGREGVEPAAHGATLLCTWPSSGTRSLVWGQGRGSAAAALPNVSLSESSVLVK